MGKRTPRSRRTSRRSEADSETSRARTTDREESSGPRDGRNLVGKQAERYYGVELEDRAHLQRLKQVEINHGDLVHRWIDEGIPPEAMGNKAQMERFRKRKGTPVPWNVEAENEASVQRSTEAAADTSPASDTGVPDAVREVVSAPGRSLDPSIQSAMEERMGDSLGGVRIHTGPKAAAACESIDARAFTVGNHVAFNHGEYDPRSPESQHVLAHELAHVRQQTGGAVSMLPKESLDLEIDPDPLLEHQAEETAQRLMEGDDLGIQRLAGAKLHIQRWKDQPRDEIGRFDFKDERDYSGKKYSIQKRPAYAPGQVEAVWERAKRDSPDGTVRDPNTGEILTWDRSMPRDDQWHMGHKPMREYRYLLEYYLRRAISVEEFVREYRNPEHYQPEAPTENVSRKHERSGQYWERKFGPVEGDDS